MRNQPTKGQAKERRYAVTPIVSPLSDGQWRVELQAPEDSSLNGAVYRITAPDSLRAAAKAVKYAQESINEANAIARRLKRFGPPTVIDWQPPIVMGAPEHE